MKIVAIVSEYNPIHSGHIYHIERTKAELRPDILCVVMSGNFCERGDIAIKDKHTRAKWAINAGADIVLELPFAHAVNCAEQFAIGATKVLSSFKTPLTLSFGSECGDLKVLKELANNTSFESDDFKEDLKGYLDDGMSYPKALSLATKSEIIMTPNNTLGIEYIKASKKYGFDTFTIKRNGDYNSKDVSNKYASATAIRDYISKGNIDEILGFLPDFAIKDINNCIFNSALSDMILYKLSTMSLEILKDIADVTEGLENRIKSSSKTSKNLDELLTNIKTKRYTMARIKRILLNALFDLNNSTRDTLLNAESYARVLAIKQDRPDILSLLSSSNLIVNSKDVLSMPESVKRSIEFENKVDAVYSVCAKQEAHFNALFI